MFPGEDRCGHERAGTHSTPNPLTQGVVPFLGTFLTDLLMLDAAMEKCLEEREPEGRERGAGILMCGSTGPLNQALSSQSLANLPLVTASPLPLGARVTCPCL